MNFIPAGDERLRLGLRLRGMRSGTTERVDSEGVGVVDQE